MQLLVLLSGKLFKSEDLPLIVEFFLMFYKDKPIDWLIDHLLWVKVCNPEKDAVSMSEFMNIRNTQTVSVTKLFIFKKWKRNLSNLTDFGICGERSALDLHSVALCVSPLGHMERPDSLKFRFMHQSCFASISSEYGQHKLTSACSWSRRQPCSTKENFEYVNICGLSFLITFC